MSFVHFVTCLNLGSKQDNRTEAQSGGGGKGGEFQSDLEMHIMRRMECSECVICYDFESVI